VARSFRLLEKKRGDRRTGSPRVGIFGELLFFACLFGFGAISSAYLVSLHVMQPLGEEVFAVGSGYGFWFLLVVLLSFTLIGGSGVLFRTWQVGTTAERRSAIEQRAGSMDLMTDREPAQEELPSIPRDGNLTNSPGTKLRYRLPLAQSPAWLLSAAMIFSLVWNGITCVLLAALAERLTRGDIRYMLIIFSMVFVGIGIWSIRHLVNRLVEQTSIGPTGLEISAHPWHPGGVFEVFLSQGGQVQLDQLSIRLVCEEEATFTHGTDLRVEQRKIFDQLLLEESQCVIDPRKPLERQMSVTLPDSAMHSFQSPHNAVSWKLLVAGEGKHGRNFQRSFTVIVHPELSREATK